MKKSTEGNLFKHLKNTGHYCQKCDALLQNPNSHMKARNRHPPFHYGVLSATTYYTH